MAACLGRLRPKKRVRTARAERRRPTRPGRPRINFCASSSCVNRKSVLYILVRRIERRNPGSCFVPARAARVQSPEAVQDSAFAGMTRIGWRRASRACCISVESMSLAHPPPVARQETGVLPNALCGADGGGGCVRRLWATPLAYRVGPRDPLLDPPHKGEETGGTVCA